MSQAQLENKVVGYLRNSLALKDHGQPITAEQLQAEVDRMAGDTIQPEVLQELFEALGNDPAVVAECLARPILAERLIADLPAQDKTRHVESPQSNELLAMSVATTLRPIVYTLPKIADACTDDTWRATSTANAPTGRQLHSAVWTGTEMIVWGGADGTSRFNTGGRYSPSTDSWTATSIINAPALYRHTAVWTGSEMIVWGGVDGTGSSNTGARYNPSTNSWTATTASNAPSARYWHTAVWDGSEMIVWGGFNGGILLNTGGRYNPSTDSWIATSTTNAPEARALHTAVWTGSEMIVWGRYNTGGRYNPSTDSWIATSTANAPAPRDSNVAVWTGSAMIVWGGTPDGHEWLNTGGRYRPSTDTWTATNLNHAPDSTNVRGVWTGHEMIIWNGFGGRYNPSTNIWSSVSTTNAPSYRTGHTAVWTGSEMIVWGGIDNVVGYSNTGGRYCGQRPTPTPTPPAPLAIIQPNGGEVWSMGSVHQIRWEGTILKQSDRLSIQYSRDGGATWFRIAQDVPALSFSYSWHVDNYPTTQGRVKILLQGHPEVTDQSDANFTVQRRPYITLLRPNGGEIFTIGQYINIHWSRQNPGSNTVDIDYTTDNGNTWRRIATQAQDTGWYRWNVPGPATTTAKVRVRFHETPSVIDTSDAVFTISR